MNLLQKIINYLETQKISFKHIKHEPTKTSEESAKARGEDLSIGGKSLILKIDDTFKIFVLSASKKLDSNAIKKHFKAKKIRFASKEELFDLTGLTPGAVPPFGAPIIDLELFVDLSITENKKIAFNAGSLVDSIIFSTDDYMKLAKPETFEFSK